MNSLWVSSLLQGVCPRIPVRMTLTRTLFDSRKHIPEAFHKLMTDSDSPIIDFYPETFEIDMNGKKMAWQGVALLPFIDEKRLLDAMAIHYPELTEDEVRRNKWGANALFVSEKHPLYPTVEGLYTKKKRADVRAKYCYVTILLNSTCSLWLSFLRRIRDLVAASCRIPLAYQARRITVHFKRRNYRTSRMTAR